MKDRLSWEKYFMEIADKVAVRATCDRASVGAVVVKNNRMVGTGYNGAPKGVCHCDEVGHTIHNNHCIAVIHAEVNAILQAMEITNIDGATLFCTHRPCMECCKVILNVGIKDVYYKVPYFDDKSTAFHCKDQGQYLLINNVKVYALGDTGDFEEVFKE